MIVFKASCIFIVTAVVSMAKMSVNCVLVVISLLVSWFSTGKSGSMDYESGKSIYLNHIFIFPPLTIIGPPPDTPMNVIAVNVGTTSVSVSWDAVNNADRYTVTFTRATGDEQQGTCIEATHTASVTVDAPSTTASIDIGQDVESSVTNMLRAYSTYFITVVAVNDGGNSDDSDQISILTSQIGMSLIMFHVVTPHFIYYLHVYLCVCVCVCILQVLLYLLIMSWLQL